MKIFLIRHGESSQNTKENNIIKLPDNKVPLTANGEKQASLVGTFLKNYVIENNIDISNATLWVSPYERTRKTAEIINKELNIKDVKEDIALIEQRYGLFSDNPLDECKRRFPDQFEYYDRSYQNNGKFYAKLPQGESPYDVAIRVRLFIETIFRDLDEGKDTLFIVSHGTTIRSFILDWFHYPPEWFNNEPNFENCSVRLVDKEDRISTEQFIYGKALTKKLK